MVAFLCITISSIRPWFAHASGHERAMSRRLRFTPPLEMFTLCHYTTQKHFLPPITGSFEMFVRTLTLLRWSRGMGFYAVRTLTLLRWGRGIGFYAVRTLTLLRWGRGIGFYAVRTLTLLWWGCGMGFYAVLTTRCYYGGQFHLSCIPGFRNTSLFTLQAADCIITETEIGTTSGAWTIITLIWFTYNTDYLESLNKFVTIIFSLCIMVACKYNGQFRNCQSWSFITVHGQL